MRDEPGAVSDTPATVTPTTIETSPAITSPADTTIVPDEVAETTLVPDTAVDTTVQVVERTVRVADVVQVVEPRRTVLATPGFGSGPGDLGVEDCQECDPARPWSPIALPFGPRGTVLIADTANRRWMLFEPENPDDASSPWSATETLWPDGVIVSSQPVVDQAGTVYAVVYGPLGSGGTNAYELWTLDWRDLATPLSRHPAPLIGNLPIVLTPRLVAVGSVVVPDLLPAMSSAPDVEATPADLATGAPTVLTVRWEQFRTTFTYEPGELVTAYGPNASLPDLTVLVQQSTPDGETVDRLFLDGRVLRVQLPPSGSVFGSAFATEDGFLRLEASADVSTWELVRYELPSESLTRSEPADERSSAVFDGIVAADPEAYLAAARAALGDEFRDDCGEPSVEDPTGSWQDVTGGTSDAIATFELRIACDDAFAGYRWVAEMVEGPDGWRATSVTQQAICARGVAVDDDRELCI